jgi:L-2-amino-thiazoline-4-carboxylic acid hydrolase
MTTAPTPDPKAATIAQLQRAFAMRAAAYAHMYDVLAEEFGPPRAVDLCSRATERMGRTMGQAFAHLGPSDLPGLGKAFLAGIIEGETLFAPEVRQCDHAELRIDFHRCPLKEAWERMGRSQAEVATLCRIAGAIDKGLFEAAGFRFAGETVGPGEAGCCRLRVLPGV